MATSKDGIHFTKHESNPLLTWFPNQNGEEGSVDAIYDSGQWIVYYIPNGTAESGLLGVAYGDQYNRLTRSYMVTSQGMPISVWGTAAHVKLSQDTYALLLNNGREKRVEVRLMSLQAPDVLSEPVATYQFAEVQQAVFLLDEEMGNWFMYYYHLGRNGYGVKVASAFIP